MKRKTILLSVFLLVVIILIVAAFTKPNDKEIKISVVEAIWGRRVPVKKMPQYYNQFMDITTTDIDIDDELFFKRIKYTTNNNTIIIGYAAFGKIMLRK